MILNKFILQTVKMNFHCFLFEVVSLRELYTKPVFKNKINNSIIYKNRKRHFHAVGVIKNSSYYFCVTDLRIF